MFWQLMRILKMLFLCSHLMIKQIVIFAHKPGCINEANSLQIVCLSLDLTVISKVQSNRTFGVWGNL